MATGKRLEWIEYNGKPILINDLNSLIDKEIADQMIKYEKIVFDKKTSDLRVLSDVTDAAFGSSSLSELKRIAASTKPFVSKYAIIGITGIKSVLFAAVKPFATKGLESFKTIGEAKDWLIK